MSELPTALIRFRLGQEDAHYGGNLVAAVVSVLLAEPETDERMSESGPPCSWLTWRWCAARVVMRGARTVGWARAG